MKQTYKVFLILPVLLTLFFLSSSAYSLPIVPHNEAMCSILTELKKSCALLAPQVPEQPCKMVIKSDLTNSDFNIFSWVAFVIKLKLCEYTNINDKLAFKRCVLDQIASWSNKNNCSKEDRGIETKTEAQCLINC